MEMKRTVGVVLVLAAVACLAGCGRQDLEMGQRSEMQSASAPPAGMAGPSAMGGAMAPADAAKSAEQAPGGTLPSMETMSRQLIRTATITVEAKNVKEAEAQVKAAVTSMRGYVGNANESIDGLGARAVTMEARVPSDKFEDLMTRIEKLGKVLMRNVTAQDVTAEFVDIQAKLRNLKRTEQRLLSHLARTGKLADTLLVEREINRVREEIERLEGRMRYLAHQIGFSTATVILQESARMRPMTPPESYSPGETVSSAFRALVDFGRSLLGMGIWLGIWSVVWIWPVLLLVWVIRRSSKPRA